MRDIHGGNITERNVRLDFSVNTNPFGMPEPVREALRTAAEDAEHYPEYGAGRLREAIADRLGIAVSKENVLVGNGASELIMAAAHAFAGEKILLQQPNFSGYERAFAAAGCEILRTKTGEDFALTEDICRQIKEEKPKLTALCHPGNPTGALIPQELLLRIADTCREAGALLLTDECFLGFVEAPEQKSLMRCFGEKDTGEGADLAVLRAFTKLYAMPGVRLGYLICSRETSAKKIGAHLPEWNISAAAEAAGLAALKETDYAERTAEALRRERERLCRELEACGFQLIPGEANFILFRSTVEVWEPLLRMGILIRKCDNYTGIPEHGCYRVAVRRSEENDALIAALRSVSGA